MSDWEEGLRKKLRAVRDSVKDSFGYEPEAPPAYRPPKEAVVTTGSGRAQTAPTLVVIKPSDTPKRVEDPSAPTPLGLAGTVSDVDLRPRVVVSSKTLSQPQRMELGKKVRDQHGAQRWLDRNAPGNQEEPEISRPANYANSIYGAASANTVDRTLRPSSKANTPSTGQMIGSHVKEYLTSGASGSAMSPEEEDAYRRRFVSEHPNFTQGVDSAMQRVNNIKATTGRMAEDERKNGPVFLKYPGVGIPLTMANGAVNTGAAVVPALVENSPAGRLKQHLVDTARGKRSIHNLSKITRLEYELDKSKKMTDIDLDDEEPSKYKKAVDNLKKKKK